MNGERGLILGKGERDIWKTQAILDEKELRPSNLLWYTIICDSEGSSYWKAVFSSFLPVKRLCAAREVMNGLIGKLSLTERKTLSVFLWGR